MHRRFKFANLARLVLAQRRVARGVEPLRDESSGRGRNRLEHQHRAPGLHAKPNEPDPLIARYEETVMRQSVLTLTEMQRRMSVKSQVSVLSERSSTADTSSRASRSRANGYEPLGTDDEVQESERYSA